MDQEKLTALFHRLATIEPPTQKGQTRRLFLHAEAELEPGQYGATRKPYTLENVRLVASEYLGRIFWTIEGFAVIYAGEIPNVFTTWTVEDNGQSPLREAQDACVRLAAEVKRLRALVPNAEIPLS